LKANDNIKPAIRDGIAPPTSFEHAARSRQWLVELETGKAAQALLGKAAQEAGVPAAARRGLLAERALLRFGCLALRALVLYG